jgi:ribosomal protein S18 acetylase RimI-like enzyme
LTEPLTYRLNSASLPEIFCHLNTCDQEFTPSLGSKVDIEEYAGKLHSRAERFEAWSNKSLVGLVAVYANDAGGHGYISSVSVLAEWTGQNIATTLLRKSIEFLAQASFHSVRLKVGKQNHSAISLYCKFGFQCDAEDGEFISMCLLNNRG